MIYYYSIHKKVMNETIIQKSRFITYLFPIHTVHEAEEYLTQIRKEHPKANHHCYAYHIESKDSVGIHKANDDGEPSGTAGVPMLETLKKTSISHVLAVVVRYFGGIKLGSGGLIRAYGSAVSEAISKAQIIAHMDQIKFTVTLDYNQNDSFQNYLQTLDTVQILDTHYTQHVTYTLACLPENYSSLSQGLTNFLNGKCDITTQGSFMIDVEIPFSDISNA